VSRSIARILMVVLLVLAQASICLAAAAKVSRLQGFASIDRRNKVVGATVVVRNQDESGKLYLTSSGERGSFRVDNLPDGQYRVDLSRAGFEPMTKDDVTLRYPYRAIVEVTMLPTEAGPPAVATAPSAAAPRALRVGGRAHRLSGDPIAEAQLRLIRADGSLDPHAVRSDVEGRFEIEGLVAGEWRLEIRAVGLLPIFRTLGLADDTELVVGMVEQPADYTPTPLELMPAEVPIAPAGLR